MNETKFTPGPWATRCHESCETRPIEVEPEGPFRGSIAYLQHSENIEGITAEENAANAALIAAAPDLYAACEGQINGMDGLAALDYVLMAVDGHFKALVDGGMPREDLYAAYRAASDMARKLRRALARARGESEASQ